MRGYRPLNQGILSDSFIDSIVNILGLRQDQIKVHLLFNATYKHQIKASDVNFSSFS
jgi:hypothetical protein